MAVLPQSGRWEQMEPVALGAEPQEEALNSERALYQGGVSGKSNGESMPLFTFWARSALSLRLEREIRFERLRAVTASVLDRVQ